MYRGALAIAMVLLLACSHGAEVLEPQVYAPLNERFTLEVGQVAVIDGGVLQITFEKVLNDSRCPADVVCVWAGNARIALDVVHEGTPVDVKLDTNPESVSVVVGDFEIALLALDPYPLHERPQPEPSAYEATLKVTRR